MGGSSRLTREDIIQVGTGGHHATRRVADIIVGVDMGETSCHTEDGVLGQTSCHTEDGSVGHHGGFGGGV